MTALLSLALKNWKITAIGGLVLALVALWGYHRFSVMGWENEVARVERELLVCQANVAQQDTALEAQNKAVDALREKAAANQREAEKRAQESKDRLSRDRERERGDDRSGPERMNQFFAGAF